MRGSTPRVAVVGGGFAGLWAAASAASLRAECGAELEVVIVSADPVLTIRPRLYEHGFDNVRVDLRAVLEPVGISVVEGLVTRIDTSASEIVVDAGATARVRYDRMVLAAGSRLRRPDDPAIDRHVHSIDTFAEATAFWADFASGRREITGRPVEVVVVGAGLTGVELAAELASLADVHVTLLDRAPGGPRTEADRVIASALDETGVDLRRGAEVAAIEDGKAVLRDGANVAADLVVWAAGMVASPLTAMPGAERDDLGRLLVDEHLGAPGVPNVYAAGDTAHVVADGVHVAPMSCQFANRTGKVAGHNAAASLLGAPMAAFVEPSYVTCIDLGSWGALFTRGWEREPDRVRDEGKEMKHLITRRLIYPPADAAALLAAAAAPAQASPVPASPGPSVSSSTAISR